MIETKIYKIDPQVSRKINYVSLIAAVMILYIHSSLSMLKLPNELKLIEALLGDGICRIAVPFFFLRSGFLFFLNIEKFEIIFQRIFKRFKTLVLPYLFWAVSGLLFLFLVSRIPSLRQFVVRDYPWVSLKNTFLHLALNPINYQLWFLRDLFLLCLLGPLLYYIIRYTSWLSVVFFGVIYIWFPTNYWIFYSSISLFFFVLGGQIALHKPEFLDLKFNGSRWWIISIFLCLTFYNVLSKVYDIPFSSPLNSALPILGIVSLWSLVAYFSKYPKLPFESLATLSFYIFLAHEPLLTFVKKISLAILPHTTPFLILTYLLLTPLTLVLVILSAKIVKPYFPKFFSFIIGGR